MAQQLFDTLQPTVQDELRTIIRKELAAENDKNLKALTQATFLTDALWHVHELRATVLVPVGGKDVKIFDLIPGLTAGTNLSSLWVGVTVPTETYRSLHGDLTWHVTLHRKDGTARERTTTSGKFNCGRFFVNTDEMVKSWGSTFKTENFDSIAYITVDVIFKRNHEEKRIKWKVVDKHDDSQSSKE